MMSPPAIPSHLGKTGEAGWSSALGTRGGVSATRGLRSPPNLLPSPNTPTRQKLNSRGPTPDMVTRFNLESSLMGMEDERQMVEISSVNPADADMCLVAALQGGVIGSPHPGMKKVVWGGGNAEDEEGEEDGDGFPNSGIDNMFSDDDENDSEKRGGEIDDKTLAASLGVRVGGEGGSGDGGVRGVRPGGPRMGNDKVGVGGRLPRRVPLIGVKKKKGKSHKALTSPAFSTPPAQPIYVGEVLANNQEHAMRLVREGRAAEESWCKCRKSRCLKLYCDCFQAGSVCKASCGCVDCLNTDIHSAPDGIRTNAVINALLRRPDAFSKRVKELGNGCGCKNSGCLKKYCECFREGKPCDHAVCKCQGCKNHAGFKPTVKGRKGEGVAKSATMATRAAVGIMGEGEGDEEVGEWGLTPPPISVEEINAANKGSEVEGVEEEEGEEDKSKSKSHGMVVNGNVSPSCSLSPTAGQTAKRRKTSVITPPGARGVKGGRGGK